MMTEKLMLHIEGMTCQACASRIEKVLNKKSPHIVAKVNFASEQAQIQFDPLHYNEQQILQLIRKIGFEPHLSLSQSAPFVLNWRLTLLWGITLLFLINMIGMFTHQQHLISPLWQGIFATVVQGYLAIPFYQNAWASIRGRLANMDVLVSLGTLTIYFYSLFMLFFSPHTEHHLMTPIYFEACVMVLGFVSFGKFLEQRTKKQSLNSLESLLQLTPHQVQVQRHNEWQTLPLSAVQIGDVLQGRQGDRIAADGVILQGEAWFDESHLTGESQPEVKKAGQKVLAGAILQQGYVIYRAEQLGQHTLLGDMIQALNEAQGSKAPIARFADQVAAVFVPIVVSIAFMTFLLIGLLQHNWQQAIVNAVSVLVIACPCALGLATPAAIMAGLGKATKQGVWFRDAAMIERCAKVDTVVLDKTGTLTQGKPQIVATWLNEKCGGNLQDLYAFAAAIEQQAGHPLAQAIVQVAQDQQLNLPQVKQIQQLIGEGMQGEIEGVGTIKVGKLAYCEMTLPTDLPALWQQASIVAVSVNQQPLGAFALLDSLKADSLAAVQRLQQQHIDLHIMSGDKPSAVQFVAEQLDITQWQGNMSPRAKAEAIRELKAQGKVVAMVGDGINDGAALASADVSFAMRNTSDVVQHLADATLMQQSVNQLVDGIQIARSTLMTIKQNLFFAFIYNLLAIPLAAFGYLNPMIAGATMALSSLSVLGNSLRLKYRKIH